MALDVVIILEGHFLERDLFILISLEVLLVLLPQEHQVEEEGLSRM